MAYFEGCSSAHCIGCHALWALSPRAECLVMSIFEVLNAILVDVTLLLDSLIRSDQEGSKYVQRGTTNPVRMRQCLVHEPVVARVDMLSHIVRVDCHLLVSTTGVITK